jgi:hypothetical protein
VEGSHSCFFLASCVCKLSRLSAYTTIGYMPTLTPVTELLGKKQQMWQRVMGFLEQCRDLFVTRAAVFFGFCISFSFLFFLSARKFKSTCRVRMSHRNILHSFYEIFKKPILMYSSSECRSLDGDPLIRCVGVIQSHYQTPILDWSVIR